VKGNRGGNGASLLKRPMALESRGFHSLFTQGNSRALSAEEEKGGAKDGEKISSGVPKRGGYSIERETTCEGTGGGDEKRIRAESPKAEKKNAVDIVAGAALGKEPLKGDWRILVKPPTWNAAGREESQTESPSNKKAEGRRGSIRI